MESGASQGTTISSTLYNIDVHDIQQKRGDEGPAEFANVPV